MVNGVSVRSERTGGENPVLHLTEHTRKRGRHGEALSPGRPAAGRLAAENRTAEALAHARDGLRLLDLGRDEEARDAAQCALLALGGCEEQQTIAIVDLLLDRLRVRCTSLATAARLA